ncbi:hypothetical protein [Candidatus Enterococcus lowellii]|uniref:hypothetical protein n=1 Tax=Candidatus Enterococcus lowellii TaxID=2230877 RepID=UPI001A9E5C6A|nr:hypothetical protein [Enterococcus sp. DIV2402]MBO0463838.1 hypothetical protein [Enterococcus sp. DIV2402]
MLKLINEVKLIAMDGRLLNDSLEYNPESKLGTCVGKMFSIWDKTKNTQLLLLIMDIQIYCQLKI